MFPFSSHLVPQHAGSIKHDWGIMHAHLFPRGDERPGSGVVLLNVQGPIIVRSVRALRAVLCVNCGIQWQLQWV